MRDGAEECICGSGREVEKWGYMFVSVLAGASHFFCVHAGTWNISREVLIHRRPEAQLAERVATPTLEPATSDNGARVGVPRGDGDGGDA